jgi:ribosomal protein L7/L12
VPDLPLGAAWTREAEGVNEAISVAVRFHSNGVSAERAAQLIVSHRHGPIESIRAIRNAYGVSLGEAKALVYPNLSTDQQTAAERLWDAAEASLDLDG